MSLVQATNVENAAGGLAAGASKLTRAEDALVVAERVAGLSGVVAAAGVMGTAEVETALEEADLAREIGQAGVIGIAQGAAVLGAAESAGSG